MDHNLAEPCQYEVAAGFARHFNLSSSRLEQVETAAMLEPLMEVTTPKYFEVNFPSYYSVDVPWEELPCVMTRELEPILGGALYRGNMKEH
jgi:hypothetical protein